MPGSVVANIVQRRRACVGEDGGRGGDRVGVVAVWCRHAKRALWLREEKVEE